MQVAYDIGKVQSMVVDDVKGKRMVMTLDLKINISLSPQSHHHSITIPREQGQVIGV